MSLRLRTRHAIQRCCAACGISNSHQTRVTMWQDLTRSIWAGGSRTYLELQTKFTKKRDSKSCKMTYKTLACSGNFPQGVCICATAGIASYVKGASKDFLAKPIPIHSPLLKEYWVVCFLSLLTCLNSAGSLAELHSFGLNRHSYLGGLLTRNISSEEVR